MDITLDTFRAIGIVTTFICIATIGYLLIMLGWDFIRLRGIVNRIYTNSGPFGTWVDWEAFEQDLNCLKNRPKR